MPGPAGYPIEEYLPASRAMIELVRASEAGNPDRRAALIEDPSPAGILPGYGRAIRADEARPSATSTPLARRQGSQQGFLPGKGDLPR